MTVDTLYLLEGNDHSWKVNYLTNLVIKCSNWKTYGKNNVQHKIKLKAEVMKSANNNRKTPYHRLDNLA